MLFLFPEESQLGKLYLLEQSLAMLFSSGLEEKFQSIHHKLIGRRAPAI